MRKLIQAYKQIRKINKFRSKYELNAKMVAYDALIENISVQKDSRNLILISKKILASKKLKRIVKSW